MYYKYKMASNSVSGFGLILQVQNILILLFLLNTDENISVTTPTEIIRDTEGLKELRSELEKPSVAS